MGNNLLVFKVNTQQDGWYLAVADDVLGSIITEAQTLKELKEKIEDATDLHFVDDKVDGLGLSKNPRKRMVYSVHLIKSNKPEYIPVTINVSKEGGVYRARSVPENGVDMIHEDFDELKKKLFLDAFERGYHERGIYVWLEEDI